MRIGLIVALGAACNVKAPSISSPAGFARTKSEHTLSTPEQTGRFSAMPTNSDSVSLSATLTKSNGELRVHYWVYNGGMNAILVFNRLWTGASKPEADAQKIYRFVAGDSLRLLLGKAPLPRFPVTFRNVPEVTKLNAGAGFEEEIAMPIPVTEYSVYFGDRQHQGPH